MTKSIGFLLFERGMNMKRSTLTASVSLFALLVGLAPALAQETATLPKGETVLSKYREATGGMEKYQALKSARYKGALKVPEAGLEGSITISYQKPDQLRVDLELPGIGLTRQGVNGKVAWEISPITGARLIEGDEAARLLESSSMQEILEPEKIFQSIKCTGVEDVNGEACYRVETLRRGSDKPDVSFYSQKTGLQIKSIVSATTQLGAMEIETFVSDYKEVAGLKLPHSMTQKLPNGISQVITMSSIEANPKFEADLFKLPAEIEELVKSKQ
jgi:hypothetical protein